MARKRSFASIEQLPSKRWRVRYTGPDGAIHKAPHTFAARIDAEAYAIAVRRKIDQARWDATDDNPKEQATFGAYAARWLANRQVAGRPTQGPHPRALPGDPGRAPGAGVRQRGSSARSSPRTSARGTRRPWSTGRRCARTPTRCCARSWRRAVNDETASTPTRRESSAPGGPSGCIGSGRRRSPSSACSPRRCPSGCG